MRGGSSLSQFRSSTGRPRACHTSHVTRHTSHVTRHTSHVTRHTSHVTHHTSHLLQPLLPDLSLLHHFIQRQWTPQQQRRHVTSHLVAAAVTAPTERGPDAQRANVPAQKRLTPSSFSPSPNPLTLCSVFVCCSRCTSASHPPLAASTVPWPTRNCRKCCKQDLTKAAQKKCHKNTVNVGSWLTAVALAVPHESTPARATTGTKQRGRGTDAAAAPRTLPGLGLQRRMRRGRAPAH